MITGNGINYKENLIELANGRFTKEELKYIDYLDIARLDLADYKKGGIIMKKKIIALIMSLGLSISLVACNEKVINEYGNEVNKIGPYIEISSTEGWCNGNGYTFRTVYNRDTKIVYELITRTYGTAIHELHAYDNEGHPVLQFYEDGKIVTKQEMEK